MFVEEKNLKDSSNQLGPASEDIYPVLSYTKVNKLIIALYIVTDILDRDEPIRLKLRTLGGEIISDINTSSRQALIEKIQTILSFLDVGSAINIISLMNVRILKKEFIELSQSIRESRQVNQDWLNGFLPGSSQNYPNHRTYIDASKTDLKQSDKADSKGHIAGLKKDTFFKRTTLGVRNPNNLMQALSDINLTKSMQTNFNSIKDKRRQDIIKILKDSTEALTITDIKNKATGALKDFGEKTLQRELAAMVQDRLLTKTGDKRWSRYGLASRESI